MTRYLEPLGAYLWRKHRYNFLALYGVIILIVMDGSVVLDLLRGPLLTTILLNAVVSLVVLVLVFLNPTRKGLRRYIVEGDVVTLPVSGTDIPERICLGDVLGLAIVPSSSPGRRIPVLIVAARSVDGATVSARRGVLELSVEAESFGQSNLRDLVLRIPEEGLDPNFARSWKAACRLQRGEAS